MSNYNRTHRIAWAVLIATGAIKSDELKQFGISKKSAEYWTDCLLGTHLTLQEALEASQKVDSDLAIKYILTLCLDQRQFVKKKPSTQQTDIVVTD